MMKFIKLFAVVSVACAVLCGCRSIQDAGQKDAEKASAVETGEAFLKAVCSGDAESAYKLLPQQAAKHYDAKKFKANANDIARDFGKMVSSRFLTQLELTPPMRPLIFAVRFKRMGIEGNEVFQEILFRVVVGKVDGQNKVFVFGFL